MKPFRGLRVVEFATVGGVPFCAWLLVQHGAQATRIVPPQRRELGVPVAAAGDIGCWDRDETVLDLKSDARFRTADMATWAARFADAEACVTPVLTLAEARAHPVTRAAFAARGEVPLPQAVPSFSPA